MKIFGKEFTFNGKKVYHAGDKPTPAEIGAASSTHNHQASQVTFTDGKTFQQKLDDGSLKGPKGDTGATGAKGATGPTGPKGDTGAQGAQGPQGVKGDTGAKGNTGTSMRFKGAWSSTTAYVADANYVDIVTSGGNTYRCKLSHTNQAVTNTTYWELIAQKGANGATGAQGPKGDKGATGPQGPAGAKGADGLTTSVTVGSTKYTHSNGNITIPAYPTALKNPTALTLQFNGTTNKTYDGSSAQTLNITPAAIGAAPASHTHSYLPLSGGVINGSITVNTDVNVGNTVLCKDVVIKNNQVIYGKGSKSESLYALIGTANDTITIGYNNQVPINMWNNTFFKNGLVSDQYATFRQGSLNNRAVSIETWGDGNNQGDGNSYLGLNDNGYNHYFRGKGVTYVQTLGGMSVSHGIKSLSDVSVYGNVNTRTGVTYSSSMHEKANITPLNEDAITLNNKGINYNSIIKNGIKNAKLHLYNYKKTELLDAKNISIKEIDSKNLEDNDVYIGFLGQELENENPDFFNLIGSSYTEEDGTVQYKIREASIIGALWAGLQSAFKEIDSLKSQIENTI